MKAFAFFLVPLFFSAPLFADEGTLVFPHAAQHAHVHWVSPPKANEEAMLDMQWMNNSPHGPAQPKGTFTAQLWMPSMGHGSSPVTIVQNRDSQGQPITGSLHISGMYFIMDGDWEVRFTLKQADGSSETQTLPVSIQNRAE